MNKGLFVYYTLVLLLCLGQVRAQSDDPCLIAPGLSGQIQETPARIVQCFNAIQLTSERKANTIEVLRQVISLYSFSDILKAKIPPWNKEVDLLQELNIITNREYSLDYDFHADLQRLFTSLNDAHTLYIPPAPYSSCFAFKPFGLVPVPQSQKVLLSSNSVFVKQHILIDWGFDPKEYFGAEVTAINDEPTYSYLKTYADRYVGQYRDLAVRFNALFQPFGWGLINTVLVPLSDVPSETLTLTFTNGTTIKSVVPVRASCENVFQGTEAVKKLIDKPVAKRSVNGQEDMFKHGQIDIHREMREHIQQMITPIPTQKKNFNENYGGNKEKESFEAQAFEKMKRDNNRNFKFIEVASNNDIGINVFIDNKNNVIPVLRVLSFMPTTDDDINEFAQTLTMYKNMMSHYRFNYTIVDVRGNGGGSICLSLFLSAMLSQDLAHTDNLAPTLWLPFNLKKSNIAERYFMDDLTQREMFIDPSTGVLMTSPNFYSRSWNATYSNNVEAKMTDKAYFPAFCKQFILDPNMGKLRYWSKNVIIVTDGTCGSACAQFVAKMSQNNRALVVAYGGLFENNEPLRSGSFPGGNVLELPGSINLYYPDFPTFQTSARARFNNAQSFARLNSILPLDFDYQAFTPTVNIKEYLPVEVSTNSIVDYSSAINLWPDFQQYVPNVSEATFQSLPTATDDPIIIDTSMVVQEALAPWEIIAIVALSVALAGGVGIGLLYLLRFVRRKVTKYRAQRVHVDFANESNTEYHELVDETDDITINK